MEENKIISPELEDYEEDRIEKSLRPKTLDEYIGQTKVKENMRVLTARKGRSNFGYGYIVIYKCTI